jgi:hypothetical protein
MTSSEKRSYDSMDQRTRAVRLVKLLEKRGWQVASTGPAGVTLAPPDGIRASCHVSSAGICEITVQSDTQPGRRFTQGWSGGWTRACWKFEDLREALESCTKEGDHDGRKNA